MLLETEMHRRDDLPMVAPRPLGPKAFVAALRISMVVSVFAVDVYFPLASGMEWVYEFQTIPLKGDTTNGVLHRKIGEAVQHNGKTYFRSHTWLEGGRPFPMDYTKLVRRDEAGFYSIDERDPKRVEKQGGKLPLEVGKKWENKVEGGVLQTTILAKEDVTFGTNVLQELLSHPRRFARRRVPRGVPGGAQCWES